MTWNSLKQQEPPKREDFWRPARDIVHEQGLKILVWGREEVGKEIRFDNDLFDRVNPGRPRV